MKMRTLVTFLIALFLSVPMMAQEMSKEEKKMWKGRAKAYVKNPGTLKVLVEEHDRFKKEASDASYKMKQLEVENNDLKQQLKDAQATIMEMQKQAAATAGGSSGMSSGMNTGTTQGTVFRVQCGAFSKGRVPQAFQNHPELVVEESGSLVRVMIGNYSSYEEAQSKISEAKRLGADSPFIVAYRNGQRISIEEARR